MKNKIIFITLGFVGVLYRFYYQFIIPSLNVDEILLGNNIKKSGFIKLLFPLEFNQSSPPLFLWIQKAFFSFLPFPIWINSKLLSFIISSLSVVFFYKIIKKNQYNIVFVLPFLILLFNPFIIYNSLTLKQYCFDMLGVIVVLYYLKDKSFFKYAPLYFLIWSLISNIGFFTCVAYLIYLFATQFNRKEFSFNQIFIFLIKYKLLFASFLPYIFYFLWYMQQDGAKAIRSYMTLYWKDSFMPINSDFSYFWMQQVHNYWSFFYSLFEIVGIFFFVFSFGLLIYQMLLKKKIFLINEIFFCGLLFGIHVILCVFQLYPMSDRLYLYLSTPFILILTSSLDYFKNLSSLNIKYFYAFLFVIIISSYSFYIDYKENDVVTLLKYIKSNKSQSFYFTKKTRENVVNFNDFTDDFFANTVSPVPVVRNLKDSKYIVSRVHSKIKPGRTATEEDLILNLLRSKEITLIKQIRGFNIYVKANK